MNNHILEHIHEIVNHGAYDLTDRVREKSIELSQQRNAWGIRAFLYPILVALLTLVTPSPSSYFTNTNLLEQQFLKPTRLYTQPIGPEKPNSLGLKVYDDPRMRRIISYLPDSEPYLSTVFELSKETGINPLEGIALLTCESSWNPYKVSKEGCIGLPQLNPKFHDFDPKNAYQTIQMGFRYLKELNGRYKEFNQDREGYSFNPVAHAAYNLGPTMVDTLFSRSWDGNPLNIPVEETKKHVARVDTTLARLTKL